MGFKRVSSSKGGGVADERPKKFYRYKNLLGVVLVNDFDNYFITTNPLIDKG